MMMLADVMPKDMVFNMLLDYLEEYKANPTEETERQIFLTCRLVVSKKCILENKGGLDGVLADLERIKSAEKLLIHPVN